MPARVSDCCGTHRKKYPERAPNTVNLKDEDEKYQIGQNEGLLEFVFPIVDGITFGTPPSSDADGNQCNSSKYLWVVALTTFPVALENPTHVITLKRGRLTHTNLTGGVNAHTAGELWFCDSRTIIINGGSSRYTPRSQDELLSVSQTIKSAARVAGYDVLVASLGWDDEVDRPLRIRTEKEVWV